MRGLIFAVSIAATVMMVDHAQAQHIEPGMKVDIIVRLSAHEREAILVGVKSMFEVQTARDTARLGYVVGGVAAEGIIYVCGYVDAKDHNGNYWPESLSWACSFRALRPSSRRRMSR